MWEEINIGSLYFLLGCGKPAGKLSENHPMTISVSCLFISGFKSPSLSQVLAQLIYDFIHL